MPTRDRYPHGALSWVDLTTPHVEAARAFYGGLFGWEWTASELPPGGTYWVATLHGQQVAGLSAPPPGSPPAAAAVWNTYINVDSADDAAARATAAGAQVLLAPTDIADWGRMAFLQDPVGAPIGVWQPRGNAGAGLVNEPGAFVWDEVLAADTAAVVAFYGSVFGWTTEPMPIPGGGSYTMFKLGDAVVGGTAPPMPPTEPPHWQVWFGTADTDATAARAVELGGTLVVLPTQSPIGRFAWFRDPGGAAFSVITANHA